MADEQAGVVGWVVAAAIDLWWSGLPRLPAGRATLPAAARASFGLSSVSTWPEQPQPGAVWKAQQRQPPLPGRGDDVQVIGGRVGLEEEELENCRAARNHVFFCEVRRVDLWRELLLWRQESLRGKLTVSESIHLLLDSQTLTDENRLLPRPQLILHEC